MQCSVPRMLVSFIDVIMYQSSMCIHLAQCFIVETEISSSYAMASFLKIIISLDRIIICLLNLVSKPEKLVYVSYLCNRDFSAEIQCIRI